MNPSWFSKQKEIQIFTIELKERKTMKTNEQNKQNWKIITMHPKKLNEKESRAAVALMSVAAAILPV